MNIRPPKLKQSSYSHPNKFVGRNMWVICASMTTLVLIGALDYLTGYELGFFIFYFIPVAISAWYCGRGAGVLVAISSAIVWYFSDKLTYHPYSNSYFIYWEMFMRLLSFLTTALTLARIRILVLNEESLLADLDMMQQELERYRNADDKR
jgi:K+-sensing histidine kinase KdpD